MILAHIKTKTDNNKFQHSLMPKNTGKYVNRYPSVLKSFLKAHIDEWKRWKEEDGEAYTRIIYNQLDRANKLGLFKTDYSVPALVGLIATYYRGVTWTVATDRETYDSYGLEAEQIF